MLVILPNIPDTNTSFPPLLVLDVIERSQASAHEVVSTFMFGIEHSLQVSSRSRTGEWLQNLVILRDRHHILWAIVEVVVPAKLQPRSIDVFDGHFRKLFSIRSSFIGRSETWNQNWAPIGHQNLALFVSLHTALNLSRTVLCLAL